MGGNLIRYCVRCGCEGFSRVGYKKLVCGKCGFELYVNSAAAVAGLITDDKDRLLVTVRGREPCKGMLDLPGGFVDPEESAEDALRREIHEELNLKVRNARYLYSIPNLYEFGGIEYAVVDLVFRCEVADVSKAEVSENEDVASFEWIERDKLDVERFAFRSTREIVPRYVSRSEASG